MPGMMTTLGLNIASFVGGLNHATEQARTKGNSIANQLGGQVAGKLAGLVSIAAFEQLSERTIAYGSKVNDLATRLGMSTDAVQEWDYALKQNGSSIDTAVSFFEKLESSRKKALQGNEEAIAGFRRLGVSMDDLKNNRNLAGQISQAFKTGDPQALIADLREVGGRGAGEMIPTFAAGFDELAESARALGLIMSEETIGKLDEMGDKFDTLKAQVMSGFAPALTYVFDKLTDAIDGVLAGSKILGAAMGSLFDQLGDNPLKIFSPGSLGAGMTESVMAEAAKQADKMEALEKAREEARARKKTSKGVIDVVDKAAADKAKKEADKEQKEAEKLFKLKADLEEKLRSNALGEMTRAERILALEKDRLAIKQAMAGMSEHDKVQAEILIAGIDKDLAAAKKDARQEGAKFGTHSVNSQQQIGTFFGNFATAGATLAPEMAARNAQVRSEQHLKEIRDILKNQSATSSSVEY
jgi:hypothetical protein